MHYDVATNVVYLRDDSSPSWVGSAALGTAGALLNNSQCTIDVGASTVTAQGTDLTLSLAVSFKPAVAGNHNTYLIVASGALNSGWQQVGTWTVPVPAGALPTGWGSAVIGNNNPGNSTSYSSGVYTIASQSGDIYSTSDSFSFAYRPLVGDGEVIARITTIENSATYSKVGIMVRQGPAPTSANALVGIMGASQLLVQSRATTGSTTGYTSGPNAQAPYWVKLARSGTDISAFSSPNGSDWTALGTTLSVPGSTVYVGLAVSSWDVNRVVTATFDNVVVTQGAP